MGIHTKVKKQLMIVLFLMGISIYGIQSSAQEMYMDNIGVLFGIRRYSQRQMKRQYAWVT